MKRTKEAKGLLLAPAGRWGVVLSCVLLLLLAPFTLRGWLGDGLPTTARLETFPEMAITWMAQQDLLSGRLFSEWNPYWFSGFPWLRYLSYPLYYGLAAVSVFAGLALEHTMVLFYVCVTALSGLTMFAYMRYVWHDWRAALVAGIIYETIPFHHFVGAETWIHAAVWPWVPLVLWLIERASAEGRFQVRGARTNALVLLGIALGMLPVISSEYTLIAGPFIAVYLVARTLGEVVGRRQSIGRVLLDWLLAGGVALGVAAFFIVPGVLELSQVGIHSKHGLASTFTANLLKDYGTTPGLLWYGIVKRFGISISPDGLPGIARSFWGVTWYPGLIATALAVAGLAALVRAPRWAAGEVRVGAVSRRQRFVLLAAALGLLVSLMFSMGPNLPANPFAWLPVWRNLSPFRALLVAAMCLAVLAGVGSRWICVLLGRLCDRKWVSTSLTLAVGVVLVLDFWPSGSAYQSTEQYFSADERAAYAWLREQADQDGRLWDVSSALQHSYLLTYSLSEVPRPRYDGYYDNGATLYTRTQLAGTDLPTSLRLHQTRYVIVRADDTGTANVASRLLSLGYRVAYENDGVRVLEDPQVGGYARFYHQAALDVSTEREASLGMLPAFFDHNVALVALESVPEAMLTNRDAAHYAYVYSDAAQLPDGVEAAFQDTAAIRLAPGSLHQLSVAPPTNVTAYPDRERSDVIRLGVSVSSSGLLTIAESWYPHWRVYVNGVQRASVRANGALLGVWLEPGQHRIEFRFQRPWYVIVADGISILTWLAIILWWTSYLGRLLRGPEPLRVGVGHDDLMS